LRTIFDRRNVPDSSTIRRVIKKFEESGSVANVKTPKRLHWATLSLTEAIFSADQPVRRRRKIYNCFTFFKYLIHN